MEEAQLLNAFGIGVASLTSSGKTLAVYYPIAFCREAPELHESLAAEVSHPQGGVASYPISGAQLRSVYEAAERLPSSLADETLTSLRQLADNAPLTGRKLIVTFVDKDQPIDSVEEAYLKLSLLSSRQVLPHDISMENIFSALPTIAWTNRGPLPASDLKAHQVEAQLKGEYLQVHAVDKFPRMFEFSAPSEVRVGDASRVRLGAYLGPGTTVMHEGFVNFNAGTEGPNMIEGRVSAGVFVARGSDVGGGASLMGTLSGGNQAIISVGKDCLLGANSGCGVPLGDNCIIEAGLYLTAGSKVQLMREDRSVKKTVKARELAGASNILFRRNSQSGAIEALPNGKPVELNNELHRHN